jgi:hypothetical protein
VAWIPIDQDTTQVEDHRGRAQPVGHLAMLLGRSRSSAPATPE